MVLCLNTNVVLFTFSLVRWWLPNDDFPTILPLPLHVGLGVTSRLARELCHPSFRDHQVSGRFFWYKVRGNNDVQRSDLQTKWFLLYFLWNMPLKTFLKNVVKLRKYMRKCGFFNSKFLNILHTSQMFPEFLWDFFK